MRGPGAGDRAETADVDADIRRLCDSLSSISSPLSPIPLLAVVDDSAFVAGSLANWLWVTFTRSDPANDVHGVGAFVSRKHWGCLGSLVIDARLKPHMPPPLEDDPAVTKRVDALFTHGGPLNGIAD